MIIRDNRTPDGRYEDSGQNWGASLAITPVMAQMRDGETWLSMNDSGATSAWLRARPTAPTKLHPWRSHFTESKAPCLNCEKMFLTPKPLLAKYCKESCRQMAYKRRRAATLAGAPA